MSGETRELRESAAGLFALRMYRDHRVLAHEERNG
jgi:hypothetical protein